MAKKVKAAIINNNPVTGSVMNAPVASQTIVSGTNPQQSSWPTTVAGAGGVTGNIKTVTGMQTTPVIAQATTTEKQNSQTGGTGNASTNPYNNLYESYKTNMEKSKQAKIGQLDTEYNNQQKQIEDAYKGLNRNAYVSYMQRVLANRNAASNMGANRTGMAENMQTANAVDYNRSVGNLGAYRQSQLSNAENAYNTNKFNIEDEYASDLAKQQAYYKQLEQQRKDELADLKSQQEFTAAENAKDRKQSAYEAAQSLKNTKRANRFQVFADTISGYQSTKAIDKKIKQLKDAKRGGTLKGWQKEYYSEMMSYLKAQRNQVVQKNKKTKKTKTKSSSKKK